jgi:Xaa-Pro aminopeptidase
MKEKIKELFSKTKANSILIRNFSNYSDSSFFYFTGLYREKYENNFLLLKKNQKPLIISSSLEGAGIPKSKNYAVKTAKTGKELIKILKKELKGKIIGLNFSLYPVNSLKKLKKEFKGKKFIDVSKELNNIRSVKTKEEIKKINQACKITEKTFSKMKSLFMNGMTELELANTLEFTAKKFGAEELAFPLIVASGKNSAVPHHNTSNKKIRKNELILIDFGVKYKGYCSDLTRMFFTGKTPKKLNELYSEVFTAKKLAEKELGEGKDYALAFKKAKHLIQKNLNQKLMHDIGHGLGLEVHDFPKKNFGERTVLKENMVLTIEPGYYNKKIGGIRIEDDYLITKKGFKKLSNAPEKITEI